MALKITCDWCGDIIKGEHISVVIERRSEDIFVNRVGDDLPGEYHFCSNDHMVKYVNKMIGGTLPTQDAPGTPIGKKLVGVNGVVEIGYWRLRNNTIAHVHCRLEVGNMRWGGSHYSTGRSMSWDANGYVNSSDKPWPEDLVEYLGTETPI